MASGRVSSALCGQRSEFFVRRSDQRFGGYPDAFYKRVTGKYEPVVSILYPD